jgi:hypothetical protein
MGMAGVAMMVDFNPVGAPSKGVAEVVGKGGWGEWHEEVCRGEGEGYGSVMYSK